MSKQDDKARFDAAVQAEVAKQVAELQQHFAKAMEASMKASLQGVDGANASLKEQQKALEKEQDKAIEATKKAEREGEKMAEAYFQKSRAALIESSKRELIRQLTRSHLEAGRAVEDICLWLDVEREYVEAIVEVMDRRVDYYREAAAKKRLRLDYSPQLTYQDQGRGGTIIFKNNLTSFDMWWEFGGGDAMVIIEIPTPQQWEGRTKLPLEQRADILRFIAEQVVEDQTSGTNDYEIGDSVITIFR